MLDAPQNIVVTPGLGTNTLTWDSVLGATSYDLYWDTTADFDINTANKIEGITNTSYNHESLIPGQVYYYIIISVASVEDDDWTILYDYTQRINDLIAFNNKLYGLTDSNCQLIEWTGSNFDVKAQGYSGDLYYDYAARDAVIYNNELYACTYEDEEYGTHLIKWNGTDDWIVLASGYDEDVYYMEKLVVLNNKIYGVNYYGKLFEWEIGSEDWVRVASDFDSSSIYSDLVILNSEIYVATNGTGLLLKWNGINAWVQVASKFGSESNIKCLAIYNNEIYAGTSNSGLLLKWNGINEWIQVASQFDSEGIQKLVIHNDEIYGGTSPHSLLLKWNGVDSWIQKTNQPSSQISINALCSIDDIIYGATVNSGMLVEWGVSSEESSESEEVFGETGSLPDPPSIIDTTSGDGYNIISFISDPDADYTHLYWDTTSGVNIVTGTKIEDISSNYIHTNLDPSMTYYYILTSENEYGEGYPSEEFNISPRPEPPETIDSTSDIESILISWEPSSGSDIYNIYWSNNSGVTVENANGKLSGVSSTYRHNGLIPRQTYYYVMTAEDEDGESDISYEINNEPLPRIPEYPTIIDSTSTGVQEITISWNDSTDITDSYNIYWGTSTGVTVETGTQISDVVSPYIFNAPVADINYYFIVTSENTTGEGEESNETYSFSIPPVPSAPVIDSTAGYSSVSISWGDVQYADMYNLYWSNSPNVTKSTGTKIEDITNPYTHSDLIPKKPYYYIVTAENETGESDESNELIVRPLFSAPTNPHATQHSSLSGRIILTWNNSQIYNIYWDYIPGVTIETGNKIANVNSPYTHITPTLTDTYYYIITCVNDWGESEISEEVSAQPGDIIFLNNQYIPEMDYYFRTYWTARGEINTETIKVPEIETEYSFGDACFLELLFSQTFSHQYYNYKFTTLEYTYLSKPIRERLKASYNSSTCYVSSDSTSDENIFSLRYSDIEMLDKLLEYRTTSTTDISGITYTNLTTNLSKLIYIYLDLVVNSGYSKLNDATVLSSSNNILESLFEIYVVNEAHKIIKTWSTLIDANIVELRLVHDVIMITEDMETFEETALTEATYDTNIDVYVNGEQLEDDDFELFYVIDSTGGDTTSLTTYITWEDKDVDIIEYDTMVIEYYTKVNPSDEGDAYIDGELYDGEG